MIYQSYNFVDSFSNASGNRKDRMVLGELGKTIRNHRNEVIIALENAEINVPKGITNRGIIKLILQNKRNRRLINNLSVLIFASASFDGGYDFLGKNKGASAEGKDGVLSKIGGWMKARKERKAQQGETTDPNKKNIWQKIGGFLNKNKDKIGDVSSALADGLQQRQAQDVVNSNLRTAPTTSGTTTQSGGMSADTKKYLIIGAIALAGIGVFMYMRKK
jgi:hypothetical protein